MSVLSSLRRLAGFIPVVEHYKELPRYIIRARDGVYFYFNHKTGRYTDDETGESLDELELDDILDDETLSADLLYRRSDDMVNRVDGSPVKPPPEVPPVYIPEVTSAEVAG
jgi:hypothetical protein